MGSRHWAALRVGLFLGLFAGVVDGLNAATWTRASLSETLLCVVISCSAGALACPIVAYAAFRLAGRSGGELAESTPQRHFLFLASVAPIPLLAAFLFWLASTLAPGSGPFWRIGAALLACSFVLAGAIRLSRPVALRHPFKTALILLVSTVVLTGAVLGFGLQRPQDVVTHTQMPLHGPRTPQPGAPNVLLVVLDTVRADRLSTYGYARPTTPFLSELAEDSTVYLNAVAPAPWTLPSHASIFTGQYPSFHRATEEHRYLAEELTTLAEVMLENGYATAAFSSNSIVSPSHNFDQGFGEFHVIRSMRISALEKTLPGRLWRRLGSPSPGDKGARTINRWVENWVQRWQSNVRHPPFFLFINYIEPHLPYSAPQTDGTQFLTGRLLEAPRSLTGKDWMEAIFRLMVRPGGLAPEECQQIGDLYDAGLAYQDKMLAALIEFFDRQDLLDETLIVVVSDHGENLGDHGGLLDHIFSVHQTVLHVPLLVRYPPRFERGLRYPHPVSTAALFATILEVVGVSPPAGQPAPVEVLPRRLDQKPRSCVLAEYALPVFGLSELAGKFPGFDVRSMAVRRTALLSGDWKLVHLSSGEFELFNLAEDAAEERPVAPMASQDGVAILGELRSCLEAQPISHLTSEDPRVELDKETQRLLGALGYVD